MLEQYGMKEVPDLFLCKKGTKEICFSLLCLKNFYYDNQLGLYYLRFTDALFEIETQQAIEEKLSEYDLYFRTYKRNRNTGKDEDYCLKFENLEFQRLNYNLKIDGDPANFTYYIIANKKSIISTTDCPIRSITPGFKEEIIFPTEEYFKEKEKAKLLKKIKSLQKQLDEI